MTTFKYDVAFSFLSQDESLAQELSDLLSDRYETFLYSGRQNEIAGADGELKFKTIFGQLSRFVVVLYRNGWGETPFTRYEEQAIRDRAFEHGYDFLKLIPLDEPAGVPRYVPRPNLWINTKRWGAQDAAAVIDARLQELGAEPRVETVVLRAQRVQRQREFGRQRDAFHRSPQGLEAAEVSVHTMQIAIKELVEEINAAANLSLRCEERHLSMFVSGQGKHTLATNWQTRFANSLEESILTIEVWVGPPPWSGIYNPFSDRRSRPVTKSCFRFELQKSGQPAWVQDGTDRASYDPSALADYALTLYLDKIP